MDREEATSRRPRLLCALLAVVLLAGCQSGGGPEGEPPEPEWGLLYMPDDAPDFALTRADIPPIPVGWKFRFREGSHHVRHLGLLASVPNTATTMGWPEGVFQWNVGVAFADKNGDHPYEWRTDWLVVRLPQGYVHQGKGAWRQERRSPFDPCRSIP